MASTKKEKTMRDACKMMFEQIRAKWGNGWKCLGDEIKKAIIAERVLHVFTGRDEESKVSPPQISEYLQAMQCYCGLDDTVEA